jgi:hypothetical protein
MGGVQVVDAEGSRHIFKDKVPMFTVEILEDGLIEPFRVEISQADSKLRGDRQCHTAYRPC